MEINNQAYMKSLVEFCEKSMTWCGEESEKSTNEVSRIVNLLLEDVNRVSAISEETLEALNSVHKIVDNLSKDGDRSVANDLAAALKKVSAENDEINAFVVPIMETLQFQDRISQCMENISRITHTWLEKRNEVWDKGTLSEEEIKELGEKFLKCTTMPEERDAIRKYISGLPEDVAQASDVMFF